MKNIIIICLLCVLISCNEYILEPNNPINSPYLIHWSGNDWMQREKFQGGDGNWFVPNTDAVWIDSKGRLHMKLTQNPDGSYSCTELTGLFPVTYGTFEFELDALYINESRINQIDQIPLSIVTSIFCYDNAAEGWAFTEADLFELSRFNDVFRTEIVQHVIQPDLPGRKYSHSYFPDKPLKIKVVWEGGYTPENHSDRITYTATNGNYTVSRSFTNEDIQRSSLYPYMGIPPIWYDCHVRINLWLAGKVNPGANVEVVYNYFKYTPIGG